MNTTEWLDDGKAAGELFGWTHEASSGSESEKLIAGQTAEKYAQYLGTHPELMDMGNQTLGERNPELVREYSHGLTPYMSDIAGLSTDPQDNHFNPLDRDNASERPVAKGIFSVLSTDAQAYNEFHSAANAQVLSASHSWAEDVKNGVAVNSSDPRMLDAQTLKALEAVGTTNAAEALNLNAQDVYKLQEEAYAQGVTLVSTGVGFIPEYGGHIGIGVEPFADAMKTSILGEAPDRQSYTIARLDEGESARFALNALLANDVPLVDPGGVLTQQYYDGDVIKNSPALIDARISETTAQDAFTQVLGATVPGGDPTDAMKSQYDDIVANRKPNPAPEPGE